MKEQQHPLKSPFQIGWCFNFDLGSHAAAATTNLGSLAAVSQPTIFYLFILLLAADLKQVSSFIEARLQVSEVAFMQPILPMHTCFH